MSKVNLVYDTTNNKYTAEEKSSGGGGGGGGDASASNQSSMITKLTDILTQATLTNSMRIRQKNIGGKCYTAINRFTDGNYLYNHSYIFKDIVSIFNPTGSGKDLYVYNVSFSNYDYRVRLELRYMTVNPNGTTGSTAITPSNLNTNFTNSSVAVSHRFNNNTSGPFTNTTDCIWSGAVAHNGDTINDFLEDHIIIKENMGLVLTGFAWDNHSHKPSAYIKWYEE